MSDYPSADRRKTGYFARFAKALFASNAICRVGVRPVMFALLVASREDKLHYRKPPKFWRDELMSLLGIGSTSTFAKLQQEAIDAGLIFHIDGTRTKTPTYWTLTPEWLSDYMRHVRFSNASTATRSKTEHETEHETERILIPSTHIPSKEKRPRFIEPTLEDVKAYCLERHNSVDPNQFVDHYTANGWQQGRGKAIRDWKAAVRTWERNGFTNGKPKPPIEEEYPDLTAKRLSNA